MCSCGSGGEDDGAAEALVFAEEVEVVLIRGLGRGMRSVQR